MFLNLGGSTEEQILHGHSWPDGEQRQNHEKLLHDLHTVEENQQELLPLTKAVRDTYRFVVVPQQLEHLSSPGFSEGAFLPNDVSPGDDAPPSIRKVKSFNFGFARRRNSSASSDSQEPPKSIGFEYLDGLPHNPRVSVGNIQLFHTKDAARTSENNDGFLRSSVSSVLQYDLKNSSFCRAFSSRKAKNILLVILYICFMCIGALCFQLLEQPAELEERIRIKDEILTILRENECISFAHFERLLAEISNAPSIRLVQLIYEESSHLRRQIADLSSNEGQEGLHDGPLTSASSVPIRFSDTTPTDNHEKGTNRSMHSTDSGSHLGNTFSLQTYDISSAWDFDKALFFCATVVTTIGYGRLAPKTQSGKVFCIVFGCIGIPFTIFLSSALVSACIPWLLRWREWMVQSPLFRALSTASQKKMSFSFTPGFRSASVPNRPTFQSIPESPQKQTICQRRSGPNQIPCRASRVGEGMVNLSFDEREDSRHLVVYGKELHQRRFIHRQSKSLSSLHHPPPAQMTHSAAGGLLQRSSSSTFTCGFTVGPEVCTAVAANVDLEPPSSLATSALIEENFQKEEVEKEIVGTVVKAYFQRPSANVIDDSPELKARFGGRLNCQRCPKSMSSSSFSSFHVSEKVGLFNGTVRRPRSYNSLSPIRRIAEAPLEPNSTGEQHEHRIETLVLLRDDSTEQPGLTDELRAIRRSTSSRIRLLHFIFVTTAVTVLAIFLPAYIFQNVESGWTYIDAVYFCFISLTTIGLGDLVPSVRSWDGSLAPTLVHSIYHCVVILYLLCGTVALMIIVRVYGELLEWESRTAHSQNREARSHYRLAVAKASMQGGMPEAEEATAFRLDPESPR